MRTALALVVALLAAGAAPALAAGGHAAKVVIIGRKGAYDGPAPHGGQMRTIGNHHIEWVVSNRGRRISVYLTDSRDRPVSAKGIPAEVYVRYPDGTKDPTKLTAVTVGSSGTEDDAGGADETSETSAAGEKTKDELMEEAQAEIEAAYAALRALRELQQAEEGGEIDEEARARLVNRAGLAVRKARTALREWQIAPEEATEEEPEDSEAGGGDSADWAGKAYLTGELKKMGNRTSYTCVIHISVAGARYDIRYDYPLKPARP